MIGWLALICFFFLNLVSFYYLTDEREIFIDICKTSINSICDAMNGVEVSSNNLESEKSK